MKEAIRCTISWILQNINQSSKSHFIFIYLHPIIQKCLEGQKWNATICISHLKLITSLLEWFILLWATVRSKLEDQTETRSHIKWERDWLTCVKCEHIHFSWCLSRKPRQRKPLDFLQYHPPLSSVALSQSREALDHSVGRCWKRNNTNDLLCQVWTIFVTKGSI